MRTRRTFIAGLGAAAAWPPAARGQQSERVRRVGVLAYGAEDDPGSRAQWAAFRDGLAKLGWLEGHNLRTDFRFAAGKLAYLSSGASELVRLAPDVIVTYGGAATKAAQQQTQTIPIVFTEGGDPTATGLMKDIARPEGNITGFSVIEPSIATKRLGLLKEVAPGVSRVAVLFSPGVAQTGPVYLAAIKEAAPALSVALTEIPFQDVVDIVRAVDAFAATPGGGLFVLPPIPTGAHLDAILRLATERRLPAVYSGDRTIAAAGGLIAYGVNAIDLHRRAASYVDRLLRGDKVADLPVQFPTKVDLVINLKTAKAIGLTIPETLPARADEVIE